MKDDEQHSSSREDITGGKRLIVVTNREPYVHKYSDDGQIECSIPAGGVTAALDPVMQEVGGTWIAWGSGNADREKVDGRECVRVPPNRPRYKLRRVWLTKKDVDDYYLGYCNQGLWPLSHGLISKVSFEKRKWDRYREVNQKFANAVSKEIQDGDEIVWIHDYHLTLAPLALKKRHPEITIVMFWHIPWPQIDTLRICPQYRQILKSMSCCNLVGFHIERYRTNFEDCLRRAWPGTEPMNVSMPKTGVFPISIDFDDIERRASLIQAEKTILHLENKYSLKGKSISCGVDRMDYTKGIPNRLEAIEMLFDRYPEHREKYTHIQICSPSRTGIKEYRSVKKKVVEITERVNKKHGTLDWMPLVVLHKNHPLDDLAAIYRMSDFAIVSPLSDGMNLVAKEFLAAQVQEKGILLISEFAGAASEIQNALKLNPFEVDSFAECIKTALDMPKIKKRRMAAAARRSIRKNTIYDWVKKFIDASVAASSAARNQAVKTAGAHRSGIEREVVLN